MQEEDVMMTACIPPYYHHSISLPNGDMKVYESSSKAVLKFEINTNGEIVIYDNSHQPVTIYLEQELLRKMIKNVQSGNQVCVYYLAPEELTSNEEPVIAPESDLTDSDNDGLSDEYELNDSLTDPMLADTDNDNISDRDEVHLWGTNPILADTDDDNIPDGHEVNESFTDPLTQDLCFDEKATHWGTSGDDHIDGTDNADVIMAFGGNDTIYGWDNGDKICGGAGNDILKGKSGWDFIDGGTGDDVISGSGGKDVLLGGDGNDQLIGGAKDDLLDGQAGMDSCDGGIGINETLNCEA
ncbi:hypothetical protein [uncultured Shewanella sp.]|uniref:calcium-binding protein n=1 Tax=uncultured Shewanella sp. TaxID=173975 RepID=UPI00262E21AC|nr:hypothetical protein [uncultured Shewanella sp.]